MENKEPFKVGDYFKYRSTLFAQTRYGQIFDESERFFKIRFLHTPIVNIVSKEEITHLLIDVVKIQQEDFQIELQKAIDTILNFGYTVSKLNSD